jgi:predicted AlkP superfamily phosphohydrolase/phosphomutase
MNKAEYEKIINDLKEEIEELKNHRKKKRGRNVAVQVEGIYFPSIKSATEELKVSAWSVYKRCASDKYPEWHLLEE